MDEASSVRWLRILAAVAIVAVGALLAFFALRPPNDRVVPRDGDTGAIEWSDPRPLPPPRHEDYRSEFVSDEEGYRFWPRSAKAEPGVTYRFDTGHCGLRFLTDFDGSFWQPALPPDREPDFFYNQDVGAIALFEPDTAVYRSSDGAETTLLRIGGSVVTHPCR